MTDKRVDLALGLMEEKDAEIDRLRAETAALREAVGVGLERLREMKPCVLADCTKHATCVAISRLEVSLIRRDGGR